MQVDPPTNQTQLYRALLDDISFTWVRMHMYPGQMYSPLINPSCTVPYYTRLELILQGDTMQKDPPLTKHSCREPY